MTTAASLDQRLLARAPWVAAACVLLLCVPTGAARAAGLFDEQAEIAVTLEFPMRELLRGRMARERLPAKLGYLRPDGTRATLPLTVRARGHTRLKVCEFPPLRLEFDPAQAAGTPFAGQRGLKLVAACKNERRYRDYVRLEQAIYRAWALLSPVAFRTRSLAVTYVDTEDAYFPVQSPAFLIEDIDDVAARNGLVKRRVPALGPGDVDPAQVTLLELFQYMIGNTDWSVHLPTDGDEDCCHNGRVLGPKGGGGPYVVVPFDFDQAGLVDAEYAAVTPGLGIRRVRQRVYRGLCSHNQQLPAAIRRFQELQPRIVAQFEAEGLGHWASRRAVGYLGRFFEVLASPVDLQERVYGACRPDPEMASAGATAADPATAASGNSSFSRLP